MRLLSLLLLLQQPLIDINRATKVELITLPAITPAIADRIIQGRPYRSVEDVQGSVPRFEFDKIRARIYVAPNFFVTTAGPIGVTPRTIQVPGKREIQVISGNKKETIQFDALPEQPPPPVETK